MKIIVVLDNIRSTHNVGAIFRTADCAGIDQLILCGITPAPTDRFGRPRPDIAKVALGAELSVPYLSAPDTTTTIQSLTSPTTHICALEQSSTSINLFDFGSHMVSDTVDTLVLILGTEVTGIPPETLELCDSTLEIPQIGHKESLNVSIAAGIGIYHLARNFGKL